MNFFLIFALIFFTIIVAIFLQKLVNCPILIGLLFFASFILVSAITGNTNFIIVAVILGIIAFISAFLLCIISKCNFFDKCNCNNSSNVNVTSASINTNSNNCSCSSTQPLTILNSEGEIVARINGNNITCTSQQNDNNSCFRSYRHN